MDANELREALTFANVPTLLMLLVQMTGDLTWLEPRYAPSRTKGMEDNDTGELPDDVQAQIRAAAHDAITAWQGGRPYAIPRPPDDLLVQMLSFSMGEKVPSEYGPMIAEDLGLPAVGTPAEKPAAARPPAGFTAIVIGAGVSGIAAGVNLARAGIPYIVLERASDLGGTWRDNTYPGSGVDTPNHLYSFSFAENDWTQYYAQRDELQEYLVRVANDFGAAPNISFGVEVLSVSYRSATQDWLVRTRTADGTLQDQTASIVISAVGAFGTPKYPQIDGLEEFDGPVVHTAEWDPGVQLAGKRVAVIGNGASAMQLVPAVADQVAGLTVLQRSPQWAAPFEKHRVKVPPAVRHLLTAVPLYRLWYRARLAWNFNDKVHASLQKDPEWGYPDRSVNAINDGHRAYFTRHIEQELVNRPDLLPKVIPTYPPFGKRMLLDNGWFRAISRPNVDLVTEPVTSISDGVITTADGRRHEIDVIVLATGFDVVRFLSSFEVRGRSGTPLREAWHDDDARAYLGLTVPDYPNFFILYGPNTQSGHGGSLIRMVEIQLHYLRSLLGQMFDRGATVVECRSEVFDRYNEQVDTAHDAMVWTHPGMDVYYRNDRGRVVVNNPFRIVDFWAMTRTADVGDYIFETPHQQAATDETAQRADLIASKTKGDR